MAETYVNHTFHQSWHEVVMLLLHLHIPKTAGTTLNTIARNQYGPQATIGLYGVDAPYSEQIKNLPESVLARAQFLHGHFAFGLHSLIPQSFTYITVLREPVDRILSLYYYASQNADHYLHKEIIQNKLGLMDVLQSGLSKEFDNGQVRQLSGDGGRCNYGECPDGLLEQALANLRSDTVMFGLTSRFDESLLMFRQRLRWKCPYYIAQNITRSRPKAKTIDPFLFEHIVEHNQLDLMLYHWAEREFAVKVDQMGPGFMSRVRWFQRSNTIHSRLRIAASTAKRRVLKSSN